MIRGNYGVISGHVGLITGHCVSFGETKVHRVRHKVLLGVSGGHWGGGHWGVIVEVIGGHWGSLGVIGGHWGSLGVIGGHWGSLGVIGGHWGSLGVIGLFRYTHILRVKIWSGNTRGTVERDNKYGKYIRAMFSPNDKLVIARWLVQSETIFSFFLFPIRLVKYQR